MLIVTDVLCQYGDSDCTHGIIRLSREDIGLLKLRYARFIAAKQMDPDTKFHDYEDSGRWCRFTSAVDSEEGGEERSAFCDAMSKVSGLVQNGYVIDPNVLIGDPPVYPSIGVRLIIGEQGFWFEGFDEYSDNDETVATWAVPFSDVVMPKRQRSSVQIEMAVSSPRFRGGSRSTEVLDVVPYIEYGVTEFLRERLRRGMTIIVLPAGVPRYVNVAARLIQHNLDPSRPKPLPADQHVPVMCVRTAANPQAVRVYREIEILGPCEMAYTPINPLPNTKGRGIAFLKTEAAIRCYLDPHVTEATPEDLLP